jgi:hypothetical protein
MLFQLYSYGFTWPINIAKSDTIFFMLLRSLATSGACVGGEMARNLLPTMMVMVVESYY